MPADNVYTFKIIGQDKTKKMFKSLAKQTRSLVNTAGKFGAGVGAGLLVLTQRTTAANVEMARLAQTIGVGSQTLTEWDYAASRVNITGEKLRDIMKDTADKIGDIAVTGGGGAIDMFEQLNLDVQEMVRLSPDQQLLKIGDALDDVDTRAQKIFFLEALAGDATQLLPLLENDAAMLKELQAEARELGVSISDIDSARLEASQIAMERVAAMGRGAANQLSIKLAPIIEVVGNKLLSLGKEAGGVGAVVDKAFRVGAEVVGIFANGIHGVRVIIKGAELVARGLNVVLVGGFVKLVDILNDVRNGIIDGLVWPIKKLLELAAPFNDMAADALKNFDSLVNKVKVEVPDSMKNFATAQVEALSRTRDELHKLMMTELPADTIKAQLEKILAESTALAQERADMLRENRTNEAEGPVSGVDSKLEAERAKLANRIAMIGEYNNIELLQLQEKFLQEQQLVDEALQKKAISQETHDAKMIALAKDFTMKQKALKHKEFQAEANMTFGFLGKMAQAFAGSGKRAFKLQKKIALAKALVTLPSAVIESYHNSGGYPWGIPAALAMAATGLAQIRSIKSQGLGGGGGGVSATSGGGGSGGNSQAVAARSAQIPEQPEANQQPAVYNVIQVAGDVVSDDNSVGDWLIEKIKPGINDQDKVLIENPNSAQAQLLAEGNT